MDFVGNSPLETEEMLKQIGIDSVEALFDPIPESLRVNPPQHDDGLSELEVERLFKEIASQNSHKQSYIGGGAYSHYIPAVAQAICQKSGFLTSYTPYQAEASQGTLQVTFEYQSMVCALTEMDVSNAGVYDGACACAEAALLSLRVKKGCSKILVAGSVHPHYVKVIEQYLAHHPIDVVKLPCAEDRTLSLAVLEEHLDDSVAALFVQSPNFYGSLEEVSLLFERAHAEGALTVMVANPLSYGLLPSAGELGADIAVGEMQVFGIPVQLGGPYLGYMAVKNPYVRQLPGRIVGKTKDLEGKEGYVLTLQTREQHIRREKATSNICTSQALCALSSLVTLAWYGKEGLKKLALQNYQKAHYLCHHLEEMGFERLSQKPFFNEFAVKCPKGVQHFVSHMRAKGIAPGIALRQFDANLEDILLIAVTELKSKADLDDYINWAKEA